MRLDQALTHRNLCESRQEAQECIDAGHVIVDGTVVTKRTRHVTEEQYIEVTQTRKYVSRGGDKLDAALHYLYLTDEAITEKIRGTHALDIGSSTGGFTDCLLSYGAQTVTAVDVGTLQLHTKLRNDARVTLYENTDIRNFSHTTLFDIIVADLSFIALEKLIDTIISFGKKGSLYLLLIKPQFEVGKGNTKKGIVKDVELVETIITKYTAILKEKNLHAVQAFPCKIQGGDGNQEYFIAAYR